MYLLDTDIIIWVLRGNKKYQDLFERLSNQTISISTITIAETTASMNEVTLVTLNKKHFPMKDIKLLDF